MAMTKVVEDLQVAHLLLTGAPPYESAIDQAERLLRDLPPSFSRDDALAELEAARGGDADARLNLANGLNQVRWLLERAEERAEARKRATKQRRQREASLARVIDKAKELGVDVTIDPNGGTATFRTGSSATTTAVDSPQTELDEWIAKHAH